MEGVEGWEDDEKAVAEWEERWGGGDGWVKVKDRADDG